jgi:hypothetical protein
MRRADCILVIAVQQLKLAAASYSLSCTLHTLHPHAGLPSLTLVLNKADQPNPEEAEGFLDAAAVPVVAVPVRGAARHWAVRGQAPDQA